MPQLVVDVLGYAARTIESLLKLINSLDDIPIYLINTIEGFDGTLHRTAIEGMCASEFQVMRKWTADDIWV